MKKSDIDAAFLGAEIDPHIPTIDLHLAGNFDTAVNQLEREFDRLYRSNTRYCRIIYGIGTGILARTVHKILTEKKRILRFREEESGGSCLVLFI